MRLAFVVPLLAVVLAGCGGRPPPAPPSARHPVNAVVATVDGVPIDLGEFQLSLTADESAAYQHFGGRPGTAFWTTPVHGTRPLDWLKQRALTDAVQNKVAELLGQQRHIANVLDYPSLVRDLAAENQQRQAAVASHQPVYGPQSFDLPEYYDLWLSNVKMRIIDTLPAGSAQQTDQSYAALLATAVKAATVRVNHAVYDAIDAADVGS